MTTAASATGPERARGDVGRAGASPPGLEACQGLDLVREDRRRGPVDAPRPDEALDEAARLLRVCVPVREHVLELREMLVERRADMDAATVLEHDVAEVQRAELRARELRGKRGENALPEYRRLDQSAGVDPDDRARVPERVKSRRVRRPSRAARHRGGQTTVFSAAGRSRSPTGGHSADGDAPARRRPRGAPACCVAASATAGRTSPRPAR